MCDRVKGVFDFLNWKWFVCGQATCCSDHLHCCPHGYKCNMVAKTCDPELQSVSLMEKVQSSHRYACLFSMK